MQFEWDAEKARRNVAKHGVAFQEAATVFGKHTKGVRACSGRRASYWPWLAPFSLRGCPLISQTNPVTIHADTTAPTAISPQASGYFPKAASKIIVGININNTGIGQPLPCDADTS